MGELDATRMLVKAQRLWARAGRELEAAARETDRAVSARHAQEARYLLWNAMDCAHEYYVATIPEGED